MEPKKSDDTIRLAETDSIQLGSVLINPPTRQIFFDTQNIVIEPRVMRVLIALAQANGLVVGRDDLIRRCWDDRVVGDNAIQRAVSKVRHIGADFAQGSFEVETIRGVGYSLKLAEGEPASIEQTSQPLLSRRSIIASSGAVAVLGLAGLLQTRVERVDPRSKALFERAETARRDEGCALAPQQAASLFRSAIEITPTFAAAWGGLALVAAKALDNNDEIERNRRLVNSAANRAAELDPEHPYHKIATALAEPTYARWSKARAKLELLEKRYAEGWDLPGAIGFLAMCSGDLDISIAAFRRALSKQWNLPAIQSWLAIVLLMAGRDEESMTTADEALKQSPNNWCSWETRFRTSLMAGNFQAASALVADDNAVPVNLSPQGRRSRIMLSRAVWDRDPASSRETIEYFRKTISEKPGYVPLAAAPLAMLEEYDLLTIAIRGYLLSEGPLAVPPEWRRHPWFLYQPPLLPLHAHGPVRMAMQQVGLRPMR